MKKGTIFLVLIVLIMASCQTGKSSNITTLSINPVSRTVRPTINREVYTDGVFIDKENYAKLELYIADLEKEIDLLRIELSKFEED